MSKQFYKNVFSDWCAVEPSDCEFLDEPGKPSKNAVRKAPINNASNYNIGHRMKGVDGNMYIVRNVTRKDGTKYKRWFKVTGSPKRSPQKVKKSPPKKSPKKSPKRKWSPRQGPSESANDYPIGFEKVGNDGNVWYIKQITKDNGVSYHRWVKM